MATEMQSFYTPSTSTHSISSHAPAAVDELINKYSSTMSTAPFPPDNHSLNKTRRNIFQRATDRVRLEYYRYEVTFGLYVMTPGEKLVANTFVVVVLALLFWALLVYFPALLYQKLSRLVWLLTGHSSEEMGAALGILETHGDSIPRFSAEKPLS
ncbi:serine palmitoyltransferase small subunit family protein [Aspergillus lucknowensis]|uniref:PRA1 family protein n=1 Tax=Aspergillus lucknowensis TaxID=176173 RepID=A0ABR4LIZ3_9EURO